MIDHINEPSEDNSPHWVALCLCCVLAGWVGASFSAVAFASDTKNSAASLNFESTITIVLSSLSIMITVLAIIIAIVGTIGFNSLRKAAFNAGMKHAAEQMGDGGAIRQLLIARVDELYARETFKVEIDREWGDTEKEYGE